MIKKGFGFEDYFGLGLIDTVYIGNPGGYTESVYGMSVPTPYSGPAAFAATPFFGFWFPVVEQRHHYDVSYSSNDYNSVGNFAWGNYAFGNYSVDTLDLYSWFGHTTMYHITSSSGNGNWFSAPGYNVSSGTYHAFEAFGVHTDSIFGSSDQFAFKSLDSNYSHLAFGSEVIDFSHIETSAGAGHSVHSVFASLDSFVFSNSTTDAMHVQIGDYSIDRSQTVVQTGAHASYSDIFGDYGVLDSRSIQVSDLSVEQGNGFYHSHSSNYASSETEMTVIGVPAGMLNMAMASDFELMLGLGATGKG